jgi:hypothetical protein
MTAAILLAMQGFAYANAKSMCQEKFFFSVEKIKVSMMEYFVIKLLI